MKQTFHYSLLAFLFFYLSWQSAAQTYTHKGQGRIVVSTGFSVVAFQDSIDIVDNRPLYSYELYWDLRFGIDISRFSRISLQNKFLFYKNLEAPWEVAQAVGLLHELDVLSFFLPSTKHRAWLSGGIHRSNIRITARAIQHRTPWLWHAHFALGGSFYLHPHLDLYAGFGFYLSLQEVADLLNYNHPTIGISYYFQKRS